jgi:hypothetical protein
VSLCPPIVSFTLVSGTDSPLASCLIQATSSCSVLLGLLAGQDKIQLVKYMTMVKNGASPHNTRLCVSEDLQQLLLDLPIVMFHALNLLFQVS